MQAQFSAPWSWPAKSAFLRLRTMGRMPRSTMLVSSSMRPSSRKRTSPSQWFRPITKFVGDPGLARDVRQLMLEPGPERHDERLALLLAHAATLVGAFAPDRLLDRVERGDSLKRLTGDRRFTLGLVEEPAPQVRPAEGEGDPAIGRPWRRS